MVRQKWKTGTPRYPWYLGDDIVISNLSYYSHGVNTEL